MTETYHMIKVSSGDATINLSFISARRQQQG
jgi:hypothetical protein